MQKKLDLIFNVCIVIICVSITIYVVIQVAKEILATLYFLAYVLS